ncbi:MAG TPA: hypothetical protein VFW45_04225 [Candidatus Polarisedimenticolia bacterium]|nr:hypothetical protein [Candidatus Polarisedimenticolia bacterium]
MRILTDDLSVAGLLRFQYRHFLAPGALRAQRRIVLRLHAPRPSITIATRRFPLPRSAPASHGLSLLTEALIDALRGYLIFHAGVVSSEGRALLICGPPGFGKTSLVMELARRGCGFLSDDYAPIGVRDGAVHPFPRSVAIVSDSPWARDLLRVSKVREWGKHLLDPAAVPGMRVGGPSPPAAVLLLGPRSGTAQTYDLVLDEACRPSLLRRLSGARVRPLRPSTPGRAHLRVTLPEGRLLAARLQDWFSQHRARVYSMERVRSRAGAFRRRLAMHPVPAGDALVEMLSDLHNRRPQSSALGRGKMSPGLLLVTAARLLGHARFVRLSGGTPPERAEAALDILHHGGARA